MAGCLPFGGQLLEGDMITSNKPVCGLCKQPKYGEKEDIPSFAASPDRFLRTFCPKVGQNTTTLKPLRDFSLCKELWNRAVACAFLLFFFFFQLLDCSFRSLLETSFWGCVFLVKGREAIYHKMLVLLEIIKWKLKSKSFIVDPIPSEAEYPPWCYMASMFFLSPVVSPHCCLKNPICCRTISHAC